MDAEPREFPFSHEWFFAMRKEMDAAGRRERALNALKVAVYYGMNPLGPQAFKLVKKLYAEEECACGGPVGHVPGGIHCRR